MKPAETKDVFKTDTLNQRREDSGKKSNDIQNIPIAIKPNFDGGFISGKEKKENDIIKKTENINSKEIVVTDSSDRVAACYNEETKDIQFSSNRLEKLFEKDFSPEFGASVFQCGRHFFEKTPKRENGIFSKENETISTLTDHENEEFQTDDDDDDETESKLSRKAETENEPSDNEKKGDDNRKQKEDQDEEETGVEDEDSSFEDLNDEELKAALKSVIFQLISEIKRREEAESKLHQVEHCIVDKLRTSVEVIRSDLMRLQVLLREPNRARNDIQRSLREKEDFIKILEERQLLLQGECDDLAKELGQVRRENERIEVKNKRMVAFMDQLGLRFPENAHEFKLE